MTTNELLAQRRNSRMEFDEVYFWTNTIHNWKRLMTPDKYKQIVFDSWKYLVDHGRVAIYAYVIMPNHLHVVWEMRESNGKEMPHASFTKFTSHRWLTDLRINHPQVLVQFQTDDGERRHRFWQRDPMAIVMDSRKKVEQKIDYIHNNPLQPHWQLAKRPEEYAWSSAAFYETGVDTAGVLTHYMDRFCG